MMETVQSPSRNGFSTDPKELADAALKKFTKDQTTEIIKSMSDEDLAKMLGDALDCDVSVKMAARVRKMCKL